MSSPTASSAAPPTAMHTCTPPSKDAPTRWTWLILACYAQLYLARHLAADIRLPWQQPCPPGRLTPARVRRGLRNIRQALPDLASAPKPGKPGPGRGDRGSHGAFPQVLADGARLTKELLNFRDRRPGPNRPGRPTTPP